MTFRNLTCTLLLVLTLAACNRDPEVTKRRLLQLGNKYYDNGKYKEASILYRKALQEDQLFGDAYYGLGVAELGLGRLSSAAGALRRALELQPTNTDAFEKLAELYLAALAQPATSKKALSDLIQLTERTEARNPGSFEVLRIKGHIARVQGNLKDAIGLFRRALGMRPSDSRLTLALAESLFVSGQVHEAEQLAKSFVERDKTFGRMYDLLYVLYVGQNRISDAEAVLKAKSENNPENPFHLIDLAAHYHRMNRRAEMTGVLDRLTGNLKDFPEAHEIAGDFYLRIGEGPLAIEHYVTGRNASSDRDTTRQLTYKIILALISARRWDEASEMVEQVLNENAGDPQALSLRSTLRMRTGDKEQIEAAIQDLDGVVHRAPNNAVLRFRLGEAYLANADVHNARIQFREALRLEPVYLLPKYTLMQIHLNSNELTQTTVIAKGILDSYPNDPTAMLARATAWIGLREHERARADLERLLQRGQYQREAVFQLARLDILEKQYRRAEERLLHLAGGSSPDRRALQALVELYTSAGTPEKARELVEAAVRQAPEGLDLRLTLVRLAARHGDSDRALEELDYILSKDANSAVAHTLLGDILLQRGDTAAAREHFLKAIELDPPVPDAFLRIGTLLAREGKLTEARPYFERTLELAPDNAVASNNLAFILAETDTDLDQALTHAQRARARAPDNAEFADTLGWVYVRRGLNDNAIDVLSEIVAENPSRAGFRYHLALALFQNGEKHQARKELETALGNKPSPEEEGKIRQLLSRLGS